MPFYLTLVFILAEQNIDITSFVHRPEKQDLQLRSRRRTMAESPHFGSAPWGAGGFMNPCLWTFSRGPAFCFSSSSIWWSGSPPSFFFVIMPPRFCIPTTISLTFFYKFFFLFFS